MALALLNIFSVPLKIAFEPPFLEAPVFVPVDFLIDFIFFLDILVCFRTVYLNDQGEWEQRSSKMAIKYIKTTFIVDLLATVPFDQLAKINSVEHSNEEHWSYIFGILKMGRLLRFNKIIQFLRAANLVKASLRILQLVLLLVVYLHCYTCLWWTIVKDSKIWIGKLDTNSQDFYRLYKAPVRTQYLFSLHNAIQVCLGVDCLPRDSLQTIVSACGLFLGAVINAQIFSELAMIFSDINRATKTFQMKLTRMNDAMINLELPFELKYEVLNYVW